jgi:hypothetical protein
MKNAYPEPKDVGIKLPPNIIEARFNSGFLHALKGGQITHVEQLRKSFRYGFRAGKLHCRELRRQRGIVSFPMQGKIRVRARSLGMG